MLNIIANSKPAAISLQVIETTFNLLEMAADRSQSIVNFSTSVYATLTSERSIRRYKALAWFISELVVIACMIVLASAKSVQQWAANDVQTATEQPTVKPIAVTPKSVSVDKPKQVTRKTSKQVKGFG